MIIDKLKNKIGFLNKDTELENKDYKFIWGLLDFSKELNLKVANLYTTNIIDIVYEKKSKMYCLELETAILFPSYEDEKEYLVDCLKELDKFMDSNGYNKHSRFLLCMSDINLSMKATTIEDLYTQFKIFVNGY